MSTLAFACELIRDVERRALVANGQVSLVPLLLRGAVRIGFQRGFIGKLHYEGVCLVALDLDGLYPNVGDPLVFGGQSQHAIESCLNLGGLGVGLELYSDNVDDGGRRSLSGTSRGSEGKQSDGQQGRDEFFHSMFLV